MYGFVNSWNSLLGKLGWKRKLRRRQSAGILRVGSNYSRRCRMEVLEDRALLATTMFLDFGGGIGMGNTLSTTMGAFRNIDGLGLHGNGTGSNLYDLDGVGGLQSTSSLDMRPLSYDFNGSGGPPNNDDIAALADAVVPVIQRALEPFDIKVEVRSATSLADVVSAFDLNNGDGTGQFDAYVFVVGAYSTFFTQNGGSVGVNTGVYGKAATDDLDAQLTMPNPGNLQDEAAIVFADRVFNNVTGQPGTAIFNRNLAYQLAHVAAHEAFHTFTFMHTLNIFPAALGDVIVQSASPLVRENPFVVTNYPLFHENSSIAINNYLLATNDDDIGPRDDNRNNVPDLAYVTGTGTWDKITLNRHATNSSIVKVVVEQHANSSFSNVIDTYVLPDINLTTDTEGEILIDSSLSDDLIEIDASIPASIRIRSMLGNDKVLLKGNGTSALRSFVFEGEAGNDTLTIDYTNGDPLPQAGFNFSFIGGDPNDAANDTDDTKVIETVGGPQLTAYFVNTFTDAVDPSVGNLRADTNAAFDEQITLRAAIQEANAATGPTYIFLPNGTNVLSVSGSGADSQGDFDITKNVKIIGTGAGLSIINAGPLATDDRIFDVTGTLGDAPNGTGQRDGGAIRVQNGGQLDLSYSAVVANVTGQSGDGGGIYFAATGKGSIKSSVITVNEASDTAGGLFLAPATQQNSNYAVTLKDTIIAKNTDGSGSWTDIYVGTNRILTSQGNNLVSPHTSGYVPHATDHIGTPDYIVTSVVDTFDGATDPVNMSIRDAIHQANITAGAQEIWLPAWRIVLTRDRLTYAPEGTTTDISVAYGDLDISGSLTIRGVAGTTSIDWRLGILDKTFELLGDYNNDGITNQSPADVDVADRVTWAYYLTRPDDPGYLNADGNDDGVVDALDWDVWAANYGNTLMLWGVS
jgi:hypothetical protein